MSDSAPAAADAVDEVSILIKRVGVAVIRTITCRPGTRVSHMRHVLPAKNIS